MASPSAETPSRPTHPGWRSVASRGCDSLVALECIAASSLVPSRAGHHEHLPAMVESIATHGLLHPLLVRPCSPTPAGARYECLSGHLRLLALRLLAADGRLPCAGPADDPSYLIRVLII